MIPITYRQKISSPFYQIDLIKETRVKSAILFFGMLGHLSGRQRPLKICEVRGGARTGRGTKNRSRLRGSIFAQEGVGEIL
jgi:hypothetical protein